MTALADRDGATRSGPRIAGRRDAWRERLRVLVLLKTADVLSVSGFTILTVLNALVPAVMAVTIGVLVTSVDGAAAQGMDSEDGRRLTAAAVALVVAVAAERVLPVAIEVLRYNVMRRIDEQLRARVGRMLARPSGIQHLETPEVQDQLALINGGLFGTPGAAAAASISIGGRYVQTLAALMIVAWFSPLLAVATFVVVVLIRRRWHDAFGALADTLIAGAGRARRSAYFSDLLLTRRAAQEVRVFGLVEWIVARQQVEWDRATCDAFDVRERLRRSANAELAILGAVYVVTFVLAARAAAQGAIGLGVLAALLQAEFFAAQLIAPGEGDYATSSGIAALRAVHVIDEVTASSDPARDGRQRGEPTRSTGPPAVRFRNVTFRYPGAKQKAVDGLDLDLPAGRSTAIVGLNGAGKTTLVKLLARLHEPDAGAITVDGGPLRDLDLGSWRRSMAVIFQDFVRYEASVRDNIAFGAPWAAFDERSMDEAIRRAGATELIASLPRGVDTNLCTDDADGVDLSGGQWQRIALARALYAVERGATTLVLDEPTANLDVRAEAELYDRFLELTSGATAVIISHRFATVRRADNIVVIDHGRVVEQGDHRTLIELGGRYAAMFEKQAQRFVDRDDQDDGANGDDADGSREEARA